VPSLFENAVSSIRMGVEDLRQQDADRDVSAVRNFYAGVLLLAKEALIRAAPHADPLLVIGAKLKPVLDGAGGLAMEQVGQNTVDFNQIAERAADFGVAIDHKALKELNSIRNDMEHHYSKIPATAIRAAISKGFPVAASLFRQLDEDPLTRLGDSWLYMLNTKGSMYVTKQPLPATDSERDRPVFTQDQLWRGYQVLAGYDPEVSDPFQTLREIAEATQAAR
jgi:hypothetical protein